MQAKRSHSPGGCRNAANSEVCHWFMDQFDLRYLILTAGAEYSTIYARTESSTLPTPKVKVADTVGAGDSFSGSFVAAILAGKSLREAHQHAVKVAAFVRLSAFSICH